MIKKEKIWNKKIKVVILVNTTLLIIIVFWAILSTCMVFNYFLMRMMPKYISPPPSFPLFTWTLHENLQSKGSKLNSVSFSPNVFAFLYYLSHLRKPVSIQVGSLEVGFESFLSPLVFPCPVNHEALKVSGIYEFYPLLRQIIFIRIIAELSHWSLLSHKSCLHTTSRVFWLK